MGLKEWELERDAQQKRAAMAKEVDKAAVSADKAAASVERAAASADRMAGAVNMAGAGAGACVGGGPMREKFWRELIDAEKIERMHKVVLDLQCRLQAREHELRMLLRHQHSPGGELTVPVDHADRFQDRPVGWRRQDGDVYF